jgi:tRNA U34 5-methylaminomethyl-2-thiouridine-forming methyltransferase MnmC
MIGLPPQLEICRTGDGSPTISYKRADGHAEKMHHSGGALTESLYIYHYGLTLALNEGCPPHVVSLGLGLGYNELIALAEFQRRGRATFKIWSFEADEYLRTQFMQWLQGESGTLGALYDEITASIEAHFKIKNLKATASEHLRNHSLQLRGSYPADINDVKDVGVFFFDAFSNKMSPELWQELDMRATLSQLLSPRAVLCTYAATGALNRVLKQLEFRLLDRPGFQGKRESTLALR